MRASAQRTAAVAVTVLVAALVGWLGASRDEPRTEQLPVIARTDLPAQAQRTVELIDAGGPFPYDRDGAVFENREELLPEEERGHYREYTVPTPGSDDRGPRRIVAGDDSEVYYTEDHYASFWKVQR